MGGTGQKGIKGRKKSDNCNSIINKMCLKKEKRSEGSHAAAAHVKPFADAIGTTLW